MPGGNWSKLVTVTTGQLITAAERNNEFDNVIANANQDGIYSASEDLAHMQAQTDPAPGGSPSLATSGRGELTGLRYIIALITGNTYWYTHPAISLTTLNTSNVPIGGVVDYPSATPPNSGFKLCDGSAISRSVYSVLFGITSTVFGVGDGSTTFNLPDYRNKFIVGAGSSYSLAATGGSIAGALTANVTDPGHNHTQNSHTHTDSGHTHSTPNHQHPIDSSGATGGDTGGAGVSAASPSSTMQAWTNSVGGASLKGQTTSSGSGTTGSGSASISSTTATNNSNTTGITVSGTAATLPPYLAMYQMMRVI